MGYFPDYCYGYYASLCFMMKRLLLNSRIMTTKQIYRVVFRDQGEIYKLYVKQVLQSDMYSFIEVAGFIFGAHPAGCGPF